MYIGESMDDTVLAVMIYSITNIRKRSWSLYGLLKARWTASLRLLRQLATAHLVPVAVWDPLGTKSHFSDRAASFTTDEPLSRPFFGSWLLSQRLSIYVIFRLQMALIFRLESREEEGQNWVLYNREHVFWNRGEWERVIVTGCYNTHTHTPSTPPPPPHTHIPPNPRSESLLSRCCLGEQYSPACCHKQSCLTDQLLHDLRRATSYG